MKFNAFGFHTHNDRLHIPRLTDVDPNGLVTLTEQGNRAAIGMTETGINSRIMIELFDNKGSCVARTLAIKCRVNMDDLSNRLSQLQTAGYVRYNSNLPEDPLGDGIKGSLSGGFHSHR
jgi:hypothetical protein